jgi:2-keto-4-pentenoate hydratase/2-oxohepta-3-ene-1,7-dioic acid hydratase in catechol pathway
VSARYARIGTEAGPRWVQAEGEGWRELDAAPWRGGAPTARVYGPSPLLCPVEPTKIIGIGSNYRAHAAEMGKPVPEVPKIFLKPTTALIGPGAPILRPGASTRVDHEGELVVVIGREARDVPVERALDHVFGHSAGNDVTARDFQRADGVFARAKGFDSFAPVGPVVVAGLGAAPLSVRTWVNGELRQQGDTGDMVFSVAELIAFVSGVMTLLPGDLIFTGTPAGVGPLQPGDRVEVEVEGVGRLENPVQAR